CLSSRRRHTRSTRDWSSDVCSSDLTSMRKAIAEHMVMSRRTSAHVTTFFEVDCSRILKAKEKQQSDFERAGAKLTVTPFFVQARSEERRVGKEWQTLWTTYC